MVQNMPSKQYGQELREARELLRMAEEKRAGEQEKEKMELNRSVNEGRDRQLREVREGKELEILAIKQDLMEINAEKKVLEPKFLAM